MSAPLRPLTLGELLDRTFTVYRSNFVLFIGIVALPQLLSLAANLWLVVFRAQPTGLGASFTLLLEAMLLSFLTVLLLSVAQGAVVIAVSNLHLGRPAGIASAYSGLRDRLFKVCFASLWTGFLEGIGFVLLVVPGVLMALRWALVIPVVTLEDEGINESMSRSATLTAGHRGRIFTIFLLYGVVLIAFNVGWRALLSSLGVTAAGGNPFALTVEARVVAQVTGFLTQSLVAPLLTISLALVYYDERVRKEAFDLDHMMSQLDTVSAAVSQEATPA